MRRKLLVISTLILVIAFLFSACSANSGNDANTEPNNNTSNADGSGGGNGSGGGGGNGSGGGNGGGSEEANAPAEEPVEEPTDEPAEEPDAGLKVTGLVDTEMGWPEADIRAMETIEVISKNKDGEESTYTGVPILTLLGLAGVKSDATTIVFVANDGYTSEVSLEELNACVDCIVSFRNQGGFSIVMPDFPSALQVKGVVEIQVK